VKASDRLVGSPALATNADKFMTAQMRRMMKAMKKGDEPEAPVKVNLEINPRHAVIKKLAALRGTNAEKAELVAEQLLDNSLIAAGLMEDPSRMIARLNKLLESV
jgi:TNF receptor-associated protein 1